MEGNKQLTSSQVEGHQLLVEVLPMLPDKDLNWLRAWPHLAEAVKIFYLETFYDAKNCKDCYCNHSNLLVVYASFIELYKNGNYVTGCELLSRVRLITK